MVTALEKQKYMIKKWSFYTGVAFVVLLLSSGFKPSEIKRLTWFESSEELNYDVPTQDENEYVSISVPQVGKSFVGFKQALAFKESQGKYHLINSFGYMGKYQFGIAALRAIGVKDSAQFMNSPAMQEKAFHTLLAINKYELDREIKKYEGKVIQGVRITESGLLAAAHLGGAGSVKKFLKYNGNKAIKDGYGTSLLSYIKKFGGYDTSFVVADKNARIHK